jgi:hypothetical protein
MARHLRYGKHRWRTFIIQVALLCLLSLHGVGLFHKHDTATEEDACVACQVVSHQAALDAPDAGSGSLLPALVLLFLVTSWHRGVVPGAMLFARPRSRAPPAFFIS